MPRLIDADAFKKENERLLHCDFPYLSETTLEELIDEAPTIDAVQIIRCKDCIHHNGYICDRLYGLQDAFTLQDNDYCSRAEPKETEKCC